MKNVAIAIILLCSTIAQSAAADKDKTTKPKQPSALDKYIEQASLPEAANGPTVDAGSLWNPNARFSDLAADQRSRRVDDIVTIVVQESASAVRHRPDEDFSSVQRPSLDPGSGRDYEAAGPWANLANATSQQSLDGQGTTSRTTVLRPPYPRA